jgi:ABC-type sugar transport system substrate-binding protein
MSDERRRTIHAFFITDQNEFQVEQVRAAEAAARRHGLRISFRYAESNALLMIHHLFDSIHARSGPVPDAILVESMTSDGMPRVARNAAAAGIGWAVVNADAQYLSELRSAHPELPIFGAGVDNLRVGEIQGAQVLKLLARRGASVLCVQGPPQSSVAQQRHQSLVETLGGRVVLSSLDADWTRAGGHAETAEWLRLGRRQVDLVVGQNDELAAGAREALQAHLGAGAKPIRFLGCDGLPGVGQAMVRSGELAATVVTPMPSERAVEALAAFFARGEKPPESFAIAPESYPPLEQLRPS